jgi:endonuclease YncB( thermonuclease family)
MDAIAHRAGAPRPGRLTTLLLVVLLAVLAVGPAAPALAAPDDEVVTVEAALSGSVVAVRDATGALSPVHYLGVESPADGQQYHDEARLANGARVEGRPALLRRVGPDRLADGARVRHVFVLGDGATPEAPGEPVAAALLAEGKIWRVADAANDLDGHYRELEAGARLAGDGVWAGYGPTASPDYFGALPPRREGPAQTVRVAPVIAPAPFGTPWFGVRVERRLDPTMAAVVELGAPWGWVFQVLRDDGVQVVFERLPRPVGGFFSPDLNVVGINGRFAESDPKAVAAAIVHETSHARDFYAGEPMRTLEGCFQTEIRAYHAEAEAWLHFYGPAGKQPAIDDLDDGLNELLRMYLNDRPRIEGSVRRLYGSQCARIAAQAG